ncbi:zonular occludens toxin domain-containing protein [Vibrio gallaecicus]|uniref:zonular occludens toxin domain-containing protein n=1 Tax=Vibrio gallaecicus TaxID=552386 RepID=UPI0010CA12DC|nr:zonular occludens toxin domain-containing protein [Vibrio gallaecicus]MDN3617022.1 zonular occludens toxin domain-containing protein [Vibrio gallaecicus]
MARVDFITGKLGSGKTLTAVGKIREHLEKGLPVATNLDIDLRFMLGRNKKQTRLYRLPDKPTAQDFAAIGSANKSFDTSKDGLIVLDECGTWFNSRTWNDKGRQPLLDLLLHIRKLGWSVMFIVQDIAVVDKQARLTLAEHTVFCRRLDRMKVPFLSTLVSIASLGLLKIPMPKLHIGIVKYGDNGNSPTVDKWYLWGTDLYKSYNTKQMFASNYPHRTYSVLPPYYTHGRYTVPYTFRNIMRLTKIYGRKYSRIFSFTAGALFTFAISLYYMPEPVKSEVTQVEHNTQSIADLLDGYRVVSAWNPPNQLPAFTLDKSGHRLTSYELRDMGFNVTVLSSCTIRVSNGQLSHKVFC